MAFPSPRPPPPGEYHGRRDKSPSGPSLTTRHSARVVDTPRWCIDSLPTNSRIDDRNTARPSAPRQKGVRPRPLELELDAPSTTTATRVVVVVVVVVVDQYLPDAYGATVAVSVPGPTRTVVRVHPSHDRQRVRRRPRPHRRCRCAAVVVTPGFWNVDVDVPAEILDERPRFVTSSRKASQLVHPFPGSARPISDSSTASDEPRRSGRCTSAFQVHLPPRPRRRRGVRPSIDSARNSRDFRTTIDRATNTRGRRRSRASPRLRTTTRWRWRPRGRRRRISMWGAKKSAS